MQAIEIDFEVFQALTAKRETEEVSYNDVIRDLLNLEKTKKKTSSLFSMNERDLVTSRGERIPFGTEVKKLYKGKLYYGKVDNGKLVVDGKEFNSPSAAGIYVTGGRVNGWRFWECKPPHQAYWSSLEYLRIKNK